MLGRIVGGCFTGGLYSGETYVLNFTVCCCKSHWMAEYFHFCEDIVRSSIENALRFLFFSH